MKQQLMLVAMLSVGTALTTMGRIKPVSASVTPPAVYDYSYVWTGVDQVLNVNGVNSIPLYTRTLDGAFFNYTSTFNVIDGLDFTHTFNRSNTTWSTSGIFYKPNDSRIGSNNAVSGVTNKIFIELNNQTPNDYHFYLDLSSSDPFTQFFVNERINGNLYLVGGWTVGEFPVIADSAMIRYVVKAYSNVLFNTAFSGDARYFDAWYLQDLGISEAYQQGVDAETDGILTDYLGTDAQQIGWVLIGIAAILFAFKGGK
jgi:hypothetical protein